MEAHGGRIRAASGGPGQGARFTFTLPVAGKAGDAGRGRQPLRVSSSRPHGQGGQATPILVVDDDPQALRFMRDALDEAGYAPITTGDPRELARILKIEKPELVLLDLMLPEIDGIQLMETVPELADRPVIFISGYRRDETIARALEMGAADYLVKPFSPTELTARIQAALRQRSRTPTLSCSGNLTIHYEQRRVTLERTSRSAYGHRVRVAARALG